MSVSRRTIVVAGLPVHVHSRTALGEIKGNVVVLFFLHGRTESAHAYTSHAETILRSTFEKGESKQELVVVTFVSTRQKPWILIKPNLVSGSKESWRATHRS